MSSSSDYEDSSSEDSSPTMMSAPAPKKASSKHPVKSSGYESSDFEDSSASESESSGDNDEPVATKSPNPSATRKAAVTPVVSRPIVSQGSMIHNTKDDTSSSDEDSSSSEEDSDETSEGSDPDPFNSCMKPMTRKPDPEAPTTTNGATSGSDDETKQVEKAARMIEKKQIAAFSSQNPSPGQGSMNAPQSSEDEDSSSDYNSSDDDLANQLPPARQQSEDEGDDQEDELLLKAAAAQAGLVHDGEEAKLRQEKEEAIRVAEEEERRRREEFATLNSQESSLRSKLRESEDQGLMKILNDQKEDQRLIDEALSKQAQMEKQAQQRDREEEERKLVIRTQQLLADQEKEESTARALLLHEDLKEFELLEAQRKEEGIKIQEKHRVEGLCEDEGLNRRALIGEEENGWQVLWRGCVSSKVPLWNTLRKGFPGLDMENSEQKAERMKLFSMFDKSGSGSLTLSELDLNCRKHLRLHELSSRWDRILTGAFTAVKTAGNNGGKTKHQSDDCIDRSDFRHLLVYIYKYFELWFMFDEIDSDDRRINVNEFKEAAPSLQVWGLGNITYENAKTKFGEINPEQEDSIQFQELADWAIAQGYFLNGEGEVDEELQGDTFESEDTHQEGGVHQTDPQSTQKPTALEQSRRSSHASTTASSAPNRNEEDGQKDSSSDSDEYGDDGYEDDEFDSPTKADSSKQHETVAMPPSASRSESRSSSQSSRTSRSSMRTSTRRSESSLSSTRSSRSRSYTTDAVSTSSPSPSPARKKEGGTTSKQNSVPTKHRTSRASLLRERVASTRRLKEEKETSKVLPPLKEAPTAKSVNEVLKEQALRAPKLYNAPAVRAWAKSVMPPIVVKKRAISPVRDESPRVHKDPNSSKGEEVGALLLKKKRLSEMTDEELSLALKNQLNSMKQVPRLSKQARDAKRKDKPLPVVSVSGVNGITTTSAILELSRKLKPEEELKILLSKDKGKEFSTIGIISGGSVGSSTTILVGGLTMATQYHARCAPLSDKTPMPQRSRGEEGDSKQNSKVKRVVVHFTTHAGRSAVRGDALMDSPQTTMDPRNSSSDKSAAKEFARAIDTVFSKGPNSRKVVNRSPYLY